MFQLSPGVAIQEIDLTTVVPAVSTTVGGFAGFFNWGPVNERILVDSEATLSKHVQPPDSNTAAFYYSAANFLAYGNALHVVRANTAGLYNASANGAPSVYIPNKDHYFMNYMSGSGLVYGNWFARYPGKKGNSLIVSICPSAEAYSSNLTSLHGFTANATVGGTTVTFSGDVSANVIVGDLIKIGGSATSNGYVAVTGVSGANVTVASGVVSANGTGLVAVRKWKYADQFTSAPGTSQFVSDRAGANDELHIVVVDANNAFMGSSGTNYIIEKYPFLSKASDAKNSDSSPNYYVNVLLEKSKFIYWADHLAGQSNWGNTASGTVFTTLRQPKTVNLSNGSDMTTPYTYTNFSNDVGDTVNDAGLIAAFNQLANPDEVDVSLIFTGPASITVQQHVIDNIVTVRKDCVAFISPRYEDVVNQLGSEHTNIVENYLTLLNRVSSYVVLDSGWKYQFDKWNQVYRYFPLNADIAGLCVNNDMVADPWTSPGGFNRGHIKNVTKLAWNPNNIVGSAYRDLLYSNGVNPVVSFKGQGTILYGDKTLLNKPSAFGHINVRRLFIVLEKAIATAAKFSLFELNNVFTRNQFKNMVEPFLRQVKGRGGIYEFKVVCDTTNNTPDIIDNNQFIGDIYIKPARSINNITLNFVAVGTGVNFNEIVGNNQ